MVGVAFVQTLTNETRGESAEAGEKCDGWCQGTWKSRTMSTYSVWCPLYSSLIKIKEGYER